MYKLFLFIMTAALLIPNLLWAQLPDAPRKRYTRSYRTVWK